MFKSNVEILNHRWKRHFQGLYEGLATELRRARSITSSSALHSWSKASYILGQLLDLPRNQAISRHLFSLTWNASLEVENPDHRRTWIRHALWLALETEEPELILNTGIRLAESYLETGDFQWAEHASAVLESTGQQIWMLRLQIYSGIRPTKIPFILKKMFQECSELLPEDVGQGILEKLSSLPDFPSLFSLVCRLALTRWPQNEKIHVILMAVTEEMKDWDTAYEIVVHAIQNKVCLNKFRKPFLNLGLLVAHSMWKEEQFDELNRFCESLSFVSLMPEGCALYEKIVEYALKGALKLNDLNRVKDLMRTFPLASESPISRKIMLHVALAEKNESSVYKELEKALDHDSNHLDLLIGLKGLIDVMSDSKTYDKNAINLTNMLKKLCKQIENPRTQTIIVQWMIQMHMEMGMRLRGSENSELIQNIVATVDSYQNQLIHQRDLLPWFSKVLWNVSLECKSHSHLRLQSLHVASNMFEVQKDFMSQINCQILAMATQIEIVENQVDYVDKFRLLNDFERMNNQSAVLNLDRKKQRLFKVYEFKLALLFEDISLASKIIEKIIDEEDESGKTFALIYGVLKKYPRNCGPTLGLLEVKALQGLIMCFSRAPNHPNHEILALFSKLLTTSLFIEKVELLQEAQELIEEYLRATNLSAEDLKCLVVLAKSLWNLAVKFYGNNQSNLGKSNQSTSVSPVSNGARTT